ncbi:MAG TPA: hypothetical protein VIG74_01595, partial [Alphaproteobacteria bacterium]
METAGKIGDKFFDNVKFDDITDVVDAAPDASPTPGLATLVQPHLSIPDPLGALSHGAGQQDPQPQQGSPDHLAQLHQKLDDTLRNPPGKIWKPAPIAKATAPINGAQSYKDIQGTAKLGAAVDMKQQIQLQLAETLRQIHM